MRVLEIDNHLKAVVLQAIDRLPRHAQIFFGSGFERVHHIKQARFDYHYSHGDAVALMVRMNCTSGQSSTFVPRPRVRPKRASFMPPVSMPPAAPRQIAHQLVGAGKTDLGIIDAKSAHALQQHHRVGH